MMAGHETRSDGIMADAGGFALLSVLFGLALITSLLSLGLMEAASERRSANAALQSTRSLYAAEAGLATVVSNLEKDSLEAMASGESLDLGWNALDSLTGYQAWVERIDMETGQKLYLVTVLGERTGQYGGTSRLRIVVTPVEGGGLFEYAAHAREKVTHDGLIIDSYDSGSGPYGGFNIGSEGNIRVNGDIDFKGGAWVDGDVTVSGISKKMPAPISGTLTEGAPPKEAATTNCPAGGYTPESEIPTGPGISYNNGKLKVEGGNNLTLPVPPTKYYFEKVEVKSGSTLTLAPTGHVDIHIKKELKVDGGIINTSEKPTDLTFWGCGTDTKDWKIKGPGDGYFAIWAPDRKVKLEGGGDYYGALVGNRVEIKGNSNLHYDEALGIGRLMAAGAFIVRGSWSELSW